MVQDDKTIENLTKRIEKLEKEISEFKEGTAKCVNNIIEMMKILNEEVDLYVDDYEKKFGLSYENRKKLKRLEREFDID